MTNNRLIWASQSVHVAECGTTSYTAIHGLQSMGTTTRFNLEQVYQMGQLELYEQYEAVPDVEVTMEKVLDGYPLIYHLVTKNATSGTLVGRSARRATIGVALFGDTQDSASGTPVARNVMSGMYLSALSYTFPTQGNCTESVTMVGNNRVWDDAFTFQEFTNDDVPLAVTGSGGVQQRQDVLFGPSDTTVPSATLLPTDIPGITASGTNEEEAGGAFAARVQSIRVSANLGRDQLFQLGKRSPYYRYVNFPVSVTTEIELISSAGDNISAIEDSESNVSNHKIVIITREGTKIDLGSSNKLASSTNGGANAGQQGSNASITLSYTTFNSCHVSHKNDPTTALRW